MVSSKKEQFDFNAFSSLIQIISQASLSFLTALAENNQHLEASALLVKIRLLRLWLFKHQQKLNRLLLNILREAQIVNQVINKRLIEQIIIFYIDSVHYFYQKIAAQKCAPLQGVSLCKLWLQSLEHSYQKLMQTKQYQKLLAHVINLNIASIRLTPW